MGDDIERRSDPRINASYSVIIRREDISISGVIENVSSRGAYVKLDDTPCFTEYIVGDMVTLSFPAGILRGDEIKGRILRLVDADPDRFIAVYFNDMVTFLQ